MKAKDAAEALVTAAAAAERCAASPACAGLIIAAQNPLCRGNMPHLAEALLILAVPHVHHAIAACHASPHSMKGAQVELLMH